MFVCVVCVYVLMTEALNGKPLLSYGSLKHTTTPSISVVAFVRAGGLCVHTLRHHRQLHYW